VKSILLILSICFALYSLAVYRYSAGSSESAPSAAANEGWKVWQEKNCQSCHQLYGLGGYMGPDLTNVISKKGAGHVHTFVQYGTGRMPNFHLNSREIESITAFLAWVDQSGNATVPDSVVHWTGTYKIPER
jgi:nitric oxide reductase subunit C